MENNDTKLACTIDELEAVLTKLAEGEFYYVGFANDGKSVLLTMSNVKIFLDQKKVLHMISHKCHGPLEVELSSPGTNEKTILLVGWD